MAKRKQLRRRIMRDPSDYAGMNRFHIKSLSADDGTKWRQWIDEGTGLAVCDCPDFHYRHRLCKHLRRALGVLRRAMAQTPPPPQN